jgi:hypothetical protein
MPTRTGQPKEVNLDRSAGRTVKLDRSALERLARQLSLDRTDGKVSRDRSAGTAFYILYRLGIVPTDRILYDGYSTSYNRHVASHKPKVIYGCIIVNFFSSKNSYF